TTGSPAIGGKTPGRPRPSAGWQLAQFVPDTLAPSSRAEPATAGGSPAGAAAPPPGGVPAPGGSAPARRRRAGPAAGARAPAAGPAVGAGAAAAVWPETAATSGGGFQCWTP